jgi:hypothetical protein
MTPADEPSALLERLCHRASTLPSHADALLPPDSLLAERLRWGLAPVDEILAEALGRAPRFALIDEVAAAMDEGQARAALAVCGAPDRSPSGAHVRAAVVARLLDLGARAEVGSFFAALPDADRVRVLERLAPRRLPADVLGVAWPPLKEALLAAVRAVAPADPASPLFAALALLDGRERTALMEWALGDPALPARLDHAEVYPLARAGFGRRAVERALANAWPSLRAAHLRYVATWLRADHPDRPLLARAQLDLLARSASHRDLRNQLLDAPVPPELHDAVHARLAAWPPGERAIALLTWAGHTPALRGPALDALARLGPKTATLGALLHFEVLPAEARQAAWERARAVAIAWETRGEQPGERAAYELFRRPWTFDACHLWVLLAKHAPDRAAALDALDGAHRARRRAREVPLLDLAVRAMDPMPPGEPRARALAMIAEASRGVVDLRRRLDHAERFAAELPPVLAAPWLDLIHGCVAAQAPEGWLGPVLRAAEGLGAADREALLSHATDAILARRDDGRCRLLLGLAGHVPPPRRQALLAAAFADLEAGLPSSPEVFTCLGPDDPWPLHERLARLAERAEPADWEPDGGAPRMASPYVRSCLAASRPPERRADLVEAALTALEAQEVVDLETLYPTLENLRPLADLAGTERILALALAHAPHEDAGPCIAGILPHLARLGADPTAVARHLDAIAEPRRRIQALAALLPALPASERAARIRSAATAALAVDEDTPCHLLDVVPLIAGLAEPERGALLDEVERHLEARPRAADVSDHDPIWEALLATGEEARAERWLALSPDGVRAHESLASRLSPEDPRRAALLARMEAIGDRLSPEEHRHLHCVDEALVSPAWALRQVHRALLEDCPCLDDLHEWMRLAARGLGPDRTLALVEHLCRAVAALRESFAEERPAS